MVWVCLSVATLEVWYLWCLPPFFWKGACLQDNQNRESKPWLGFKLRNTLLLNPDGRIMAQPGSRPQAGFLAVAPGHCTNPSGLQDPYLIMSACFSPRPWQPLVLHPHLCLNRAMSYCCTASPTCFAVLTFKFYVDLTEFPFVKQLQLIWAIITFAFYIIEHW